MRATVAACIRKRLLARRPNFALKKSFDWLALTKVIPVVPRPSAKAKASMLKGWRLFSSNAARLPGVGRRRQRYIDFVQGLLPNLLGYANEEVNAAVTQQLSQGHSFRYPSLEVELAERLTG